MQNSLSCLQTTSNKCCSLLVYSFFQFKNENKVIYRIIVLIFVMYVYEYTNYEVLFSNCMYKLEE